MAHKPYRAVFRWADGKGWLYSEDETQRVEVVHVDCSNEADGDWDLLDGSVAVESLRHVSGRYVVRSFLVTVKSGCKAPYGTPVAWEAA